MPTPKYRVRVDWNHGGVGARTSALDFTTNIDDITSDCRNVSLTHNRNLSTELMESAVLGLEVNNQANYYSPTNASSALTGLLLPGKPVWVQMFYPYDTFDGSEAALATHTPDHDAAWTWVDATGSSTGGERVAGGFEIDGSGNARLAGTPPFTSGNVGNRISYLEFGDSDVHLHAKITTPSTGKFSGGDDVGTGSPAYYTSYSFGAYPGTQVGKNLAAMFGFVIRYTDNSNYQAVGFDASENNGTSDTAHDERNDKVFLLTYSTDRVVGAADSVIGVADGTITAADGDLYKIGQHILVENEIMKITGVSSDVLSVTRGALGTAARAHGYASGSGSSTQVVGPFKAPLLQFANLSSRHSPDSTTWRQGATHEVQVHARGNYIDVTVDGAHCTPSSESNQMPFSIGGLGNSNDSLHGTAEPDTSHTFKTEASASTGTKHGIWRLDKVQNAAYYGQTAGGQGHYMDGHESFEEFGGYRSLFFGYISSITPDPDPMAQLCYIEAYDEMETAKRTEVQYAAADDLSRLPMYCPLFEVLYHAGLFIADWTTNVNFQTTNVIFEPFLTATGPYSGESIATTMSALKPIKDNVQNILATAQLEEDGFTYVDGEGFLRLESRVHRTGAGTNHTPSTWLTLGADSVSIGAAHSDGHNSLTGHVTADHILYGHTSSACTFVDAYDGTNPAYTAISYSDGHELIENRIQMSVTGMVKQTAANTAVAVWTSAEAADAQQRVELPTGNSYLIAELPAAFETAHAITLPSTGASTLEIYSARSGGSDVSGSVAVTQEKGVGDPQFSAFKFKFANTSGAVAYLRKFIVKTGTGNPDGGYKRGEKTIVEATDATSVTAYGERKKTLANLFITSPEVAQDMLDARLARKKDPKAIITLTLAAGDKVTLRAMMTRRFSDRVIVKNDDMGMTTTGGSALNKAFYVEGETWDISEGGTVIEQNLLLRAV